MVPTAFEKNSSRYSASVEKNNKPSEALFESEGFTPTSFSELSKRHGNLHTLNLYREMLVVPGEVLLRNAMARDFLSNH